MNESAANGDSPSTTNSGTSSPTRGDSALPTHVDSASAAHDDSLSAYRDPNYGRALDALERTIDKLRRCSDEEKQKLQGNLTELNDMVARLTTGRVEIAVLGEISTGKSALINALVGRDVAAVDVQGGWTRQVWKVPWEGAGYVMPGLGDSQVVLIDTPGLNEVGGAERAEMARQAAERADLILFVTDSDLNETEHSALRALAAAHKPLILVLNKMDLYPPEQRDRLLSVLCNDRAAGLVSPQHVVTTAADPREVEYVIQSADGASKSQWRTPPPQVEELKACVLNVLEQEGMALLALNAALFASDTSDRIASLRVQLRRRKADQVIWSYAVLKSLAVALNPYPVADVLGGSAVDATMIVALSHIYGLEMSWRHAQRLVAAIIKAAGWVVAGELTTHAISIFFKALTAGYGVVLTALPQGAAAGYGSYIVGKAARYYLEHGASWGGHSPKSVVKSILRETDKQSVLQGLKDEIRRKLNINPHADTAKKRDSGEDSSSRGGGNA